MALGFWSKHVMIVKSDMLMTVFWVCVSDRKPRKYFGEQRPEGWNTSAQ
jgi:hypothetical protein